MKSQVKAMGVEILDSGEVMIMGDVCQTGANGNDPSWSVGFSIIVDRRGKWGITDGTRPMIRFMDREDAVEIIESLLDKRFYWKHTTNTHRHEKVDLTSDEVRLLEGQLDYLMGDWSDGEGIPKEQQS
ncbi:MAG: hypothetical protein KAW09_07420 [Thermoplasmata archaeon]|nr:hypothetical protein [Thermoplasmata archaeon]